MRYHAPELIASGTLHRRVLIVTLPRRGTPFGPRAIAAIMGIEKKKGGDRPAEDAPRE
jgi:hypothetical protein